MGIQDIFPNGTATDQMFLNDALHLLERKVGVPNPFRIDHHDGALFTDAKAVALGALDAMGAFMES